MSRTSILTLAFALAVSACAGQQSTPNDRPAGQSRSASPSLTPSATPPARGVGAVVVWVDDGDTIDVNLPSGRRQRVRLIGINAPENNPESTQCGGADATAGLRARLPLGSRVRLLADPTQDRVDRYGRWLRYVEYQGVDLNRWLVRRGHAEVYVYGHRAFQRHAGYLNAQQRAQRAGRGLWACPG